MSIWSLLGTSWIRSQKYSRSHARTVQQSRRFRPGQLHPLERVAQFEELEDRLVLYSHFDIDPLSPYGEALIDFHGEDLQGKDGVLSSVSFDLALLYNEYEDFIEAGGENGFTSSNSMVQMDRTGNYVLIDMALTTDATSTLSSLESIGFVVNGTYGRLASGFLPIGAIAEFAGFQELQYAAATSAALNVGSVTSQADVSMLSDEARAEFGVDGSGITVGVLSDSFNFLGGYGSDIDSGDLPDDVIILSDSGTSDEGRAMAQLIYDVAPGVDLAFHTAFGGMADFASGIVQLATDAGADVIVDDVIYFAEPMFQDGIIAQAVDQVVGMGVSYFSSAGNSGRASYESAYRNSGINLGSEGDNIITEYENFFAHDFNPGVDVDIYQTVTFPSFGAPMSFQWDDSFFSASGVGAETDMDIAFFDMDGNFITGSFDANIGGDAYELLQGFGQVQIAIGKYAGPDPTMVKYVVFDSDFVMNEYNTASGTAFGHANAAGAEAVGAAYYLETPEFGVDPPLVEDFSSAGQIPILFDTDGNRLGSPEYRATPGITAPDGTNTTFFGFDSDGDGFPNFFGTSAAAPHAAAVAALMLNMAGGPGTMTPAEQYSFLEMTAVDMNDPSTPGFDVGFDYATGYGLVNAFDAVQAVQIAYPQAPVADADGYYILGTRDMIRLDGSGSFDVNQPDETLTYLWDYGADGDYDAVGINPYFTTADLEGNSYVKVRLKVIDDGGLVDTDITRVYAEDESQLRIRGSVYGVVGQRRTLTLDLVGPATNQDDYVYTVNWGDGTASQTFTGPDGLKVTKIYNRVGDYKVRVTATHSVTGLKTSDTHHFRIGLIQQQGDDVAITGTNGDDDFRVVTRPGQDRVEIYLNRVSLGVYTVPGTVYAIGMKGDDRFRADDGTYNVYWDGGRGNDVSYTYGGNDTIYGYTGDDRIYDYGGKNYINAGSGNNTVNSGSGNDRIIAGSGNDRITDIGGDNEISAGDGDNQIFTRRGNDYIMTGSGSDRVIDDGGNNYITVGDGSNVVRTGVGSDTILGGAQDDNIYADGELFSGLYNYISTFGGNDYIVAWGFSFIDSGLGDDFIFANNLLDDDDDLFSLLARSR